MMKKTIDYWNNRFLQLKKSEISDSHKVFLTLEREFKKASNDLEKELSNWYNRFAKNNNITLAEAKKLLKNNELEEFKWTVYEYIEYAKEYGLDPKWIKKLENVSAKQQISRLEAIHLQLRQKVEILYKKQVDDVSSLAKQMYSDTYYHTAFEVQKGIGLGFTFNAFNESELDQIIKKPWTVDGVNFSDRIWTNKNKLINTLQTELTQGLIKGDGLGKAINNIAKQFNVSKNQAGRLVMTESAYFSSEARKKCFNFLNVEKYRIVATLDMKTSEICQDMDGLIFKMSEHQVGLNAPPFHPYCRTTIAPYFEDMEDIATRTARDKTGKSFSVPANMKYAEWKKKFIINEVS